MLKQPLLGGFGSSSLATDFEGHPSRFHKSLSERSAGVDLGYLDLRSEGGDMVLGGGGGRSYYSAVSPLSSPGVVDEEEDAAFRSSTTSMQQKPLQTKTPSSSRESTTTMEATNVAMAPSIHATTQDFRPPRPPGKRHLESCSEKA